MGGMGCAEEAGDESPAYQLRALPGGDVVRPRSHPSGKMRRMDGAPAFGKDGEGWDNCRWNSLGDLDVVPAVFFGVFYFQDWGLSWRKLNSILNGVNREIMQSEDLVRRGQVQSSRPRQKRLSGPARSARMRPFTLSAFVTPMSAAGTGGGSCRGRMPSRLVSRSRTALWGSSVSA